ncbi:MAG: hypothetical protein JWN94_1936 [Betaproteobacteria bacterium]|nr:hypothetical protein [Betaproteobacteria bacterium]
MHDIRKLIVCLLVVLISASAFDVMAQFGGGMRGRSGGSRSQGGVPRGESPGGGNDAANVLDYRLESMQEDLKLTPVQQRLWDAYAEKVRALGGDIVRERDRTKTPTVTPLTAPQQMAHALDVARNRMTALEDIAASANALYDNLTPEQKLLADSRVASLVPFISINAPASGVPERAQQKPPAGGREAGGPR